ncbi:PLC-like phosphodiesterase [Mycena albidolilacea]|uniref:phosphoinositide phospholipase C n=1 Tax=Mycena albidolilacea TaxID=1033008 RepID=A0AAD6ZEP6_9AGAR|nr:PLC-like phosphodiesterase [Mycena albidolilacea]
MPRGVQLESNSRRDGTGTKAEADADSSPESEDEEEEEDGDVMIKVGKTEKPKISDELAELGFYAHFTESANLRPLHVLINISESACAAIPTSALPRLVSHAQSHLRRVFPRGTRIRSGNPDPLARVWRAGGHISALNWQRYDAGMQLNEGLFVGSPGWGIQRQRLVGEIVGISALPPPYGRAAKACSAYVYAELLHFEQDRTWSTNVTQDVPGAGANVLWNERFEWEFAADDLAFLRLTVMQSEFGRDDKIVSLPSVFLTERGEFPHPPHTRAFVNTT